MSAQFIRFTRSLILFSILISLLSIGAMYVLPAKYITPMLPYLIIFFMIISLAVYYFIEKAIAKRFVLFTNYFMIATMAKILIYLAIIVLYALSHKNDAVPFILTFFLFYTGYTTFEVIWMLRMREQQK
jgi:hypothetical protein